MRFEPGAREDRSLGLAEVIYLPGVKPPPASETTAETGDDLPEFVETEIRAEALKLLTRRDLSKRELATKLSHFDLELVDRELSSLENLGYLDDDRACRVLAQRLVSKKLVGIKAIRAELVKRGFETDTISSALADLDQDDDLQKARKYLQDKVRKGSNTDQEVLIRRLSSQLSRRGFSTEVVLKAISEQFRS